MSDLKWYQKLSLNQKDVYYRMLLAFGLGTAPSLFFFGGAAHWLSGKARTWMLRSAGLVVAGMGVINLVKHLRMMGIIGL